MSQLTAWRETLKLAQIHLWHGVKSDMGFESESLVAHFLSTSPLALLWALQHPYPVLPWSKTKTTTTTQPTKKEHKEKNNNKKKNNLKTLSLEMYYHLQFFMDQICLSPMTTSQNRSRKAGKDALTHQGHYQVNHSVNILHWQSF